MEATLSPSVMRYKAKFGAFGSVLLGVAVIAAFGLLAMVPASATASYTTLCEQSGIGCISFSGYSGQSVWGYPVDSKGNNCTNYVAYRLSQAGMSNPGNLGNAGSWAENASAKGFRVDGTPTVGAIAQWNYGSAYAPSSGHVAYVEEVGAGYIVETESNWEGPSRRVRITSGDRYWPNNFIHFHDAGGMPGEGSFVQVAGKAEIYRIVGGAPLYVSTWAAFGGPQHYSVISQQQFNELRPHPADGTFFQDTTTSAIYRIAGGAPFYVTSWSAFGGPQQYLTIDHWDIEHAGSQLAHVNPYPEDGTLVYGTATRRTYVVAGGAPEYISASDANKIPGWGTKPITAVDEWNFEHIGNELVHLLPYPRDGTLVANVDDGRCYVVAGGAPEYIAASDAHNVPGWGSAPVTGLSGYEFTNYEHLRRYPADGTLIYNADNGRAYTVAGGAPEYVSAADAFKVPSYTGHQHIGISSYELENYEHLRRYPADGTLVANVDDGRCYVIAGGAPEYVTAADSTKIPGWGSATVTGLSGYELENYEHLRRYPVDGTFLKTTSGNAYRIAGGAVFTVSDWAVFGGTQQTVTIDQWNVEHAGEAVARLNSSPVDGTTLQGLPSDSYWVFKSGYRTSATPSPQAIAVNDASLTAFPEPPKPPASTGIPTIHGTATIGATLTVTEGTWSGTAPITYSYQWLRDGTPIPGATGVTYVITAADAGHLVVVQVTATNSVGSAMATSATVEVPIVSGVGSSAGSSTAGTANTNGGSKNTGGSSTGTQTTPNRSLRKRPASRRKHPKRHNSCREAKTKHESKVCRAKARRRAAQNRQSKHRK